MSLLLRPGARPSTAAALFAAASARMRPEHLALGRTGLGVGMVVRPRLLPGLLGVDSATSTRMAWSTQMLGAREVALGLGTLVALRGPDRKAARLWLAGGVLCDTVDALAVGAAVAKGRISAGTGVLGAVSGLAAAAVGLRAVREIDA